MVIVLIDLHKSYFYDKQFGLSFFVLIWKSLILFLNSFLINIFSIIFHHIILKFHLWLIFKAPFPPLLRHS